LRGAYADRLVADTQHLSDWAFVRAGDLVDISAPIDLLGVNYYSPAKVTAVGRDGIGAAVGRDGIGTSQEPLATVGGHHGSVAAMWPGTDLARSVPQPGPYTDMGWPIDPGGLTRLLVRLGREYPELPLVVTENGAAF